MISVVPPPIMMSGFIGGIGVGVGVGYGVSPPSPGFSGYSSGIVYTLGGVILNPASLKFTSYPFTLRTFVSMTSALSVAVSVVYLDIFKYYLSYFHSLI